VDALQQNHRAEHKNCHILNVARALKFQASLPVTCWGECALTAAYLFNCTPTNILGSKAPYEALFGVQPSYKHIWVFGSLCYVHNHSRTRDKFDTRALSVYSWGIHMIRRDATSMILKWSIYLFLGMWYFKNKLFLLLQAMIKRTCQSFWTLITISPIIPTVLTNT